MKNFLFSTTRQWNCGDEFILFGVRNILSEFLGGGFNALIYNRNPSIRPVFRTRLSQSYDIIRKLIFNTIPECDNSYHVRIDGSFIDAAISAGTPEWYGKRTRQFYETIRKYKIPYLVLGAGGIGRFKNYERDIISSAKVLTFRTPKLTESAKSSGLEQAIYLPCPALLSAKAQEEKIWTEECRTIGLGFNIPHEQTVPYIGISKTTFEFSTTLYSKLIRKMGDRYQFVGICHYIDELPYAIKFFKQFDVPVKYSYDSKDFFAIYRDIDFLISSRVHGCGIAASLGIPSVGISHDTRGETIRGFLSEVVTPDCDVELCLSNIKDAIDGANQKHESLKAHKEQTKLHYLDILEKDAAFLKIQENQRQIVT